MKTTEESHETRVTLKDGATYLATWSQSFGKAPTVGERVSFPPHVGNLVHLEGFRSRGRVSKVQIGPKAHESFIEMEAEPRSGFRRTITLNAGFIAGDLRMDAERRVRQTLPDTRVIWEDSMEPMAVLRMSDSGTFPKGTLEDAHRSRGEAYAERELQSARVTLEAQLRQMLTRSREVLAHF